MAIGTVGVYKINVEVELSREVCGQCAVQFAYPTTLMKKAAADHSRRFWCPNGHSLAYLGKTTAQKLEEELERARRYHADTREQLAAERKSHASTKGKVTKLRNRAEKGVCSDCNRTFANYAKHQADVHGIDNGWARKA